MPTKDVHITIEQDLYDEIKKDDAPFNYLVRLGWKAHTQNLPLLERLGKAEAHIELLRKFREDKLKIDYNQREQYTKVMERLAIIEKHLRLYEVLADDKNNDKHND